MLKKILWTTVAVIIVTVLYLVAWPVPIDPIAWEAPPNPGYSGPFAPNQRLTGIETLPLGDNHGPEDIAIDAQGRIYASTREGRIVRLQADGFKPGELGRDRWSPTGYRF